MCMIIHKLNLNDRAFNAIINGTKRVELRASSDECNYNDFKINDKIIFRNTNNQEIMCMITENNHYDSLEELLMLENTNEVLRKYVIDNRKKWLHEGDSKKGFNF